MPLYSIFKVCAVTIANRIITNKVKTIPKMTKIIAIIKKTAAKTTVKIVAKTVVKIVAKIVAVSIKNQPK
ncbi:hypothetical protein GCM10020331_020500 [Ectobacillus funiculus]